MAVRVVAGCDGGWQGIDFVPEREIDVVDRAVPFHPQIQAKFRRRSHDVAHPRFVLRRYGTLPHDGIVRCQLVKVLVFG